MRFAVTLAIVLGLATVGCNREAQDKKKDQDLALQRLIFLAATLPTDVTGKCIAEHDSGLSCATAAGASISTYAGQMQNIYGVPVASATTSSGLCAQIPNSAFFSSLTASAKICHFGCNKAYFDRMQSAGKCTSTQINSVLTIYSSCLPLVWLTSCPDANYTGCLNNCFKTGSVIP